jgi:hypothetical protein
MAVPTRHTHSSTSQHRRHKLKKYELGRGVIEDSRQRSGDPEMGGIARLFGRIAHQRQSSGKWPWVTRAQHCGDGDDTNEDAGEQLSDFANRLAPSAAKDRRGP